MIPKKSHRVRLSKFLNLSGEKKLKQFKSTTNELEECPENAYLNVQISSP